MINILKAKFALRKPKFSTISELKESTLQTNERLFLVAEGFLYITLIAGMMGVLKNMIIGFMTRKRSFAMLRSIGMNKFQLIKMLLIESLTSGLIGSIIGVAVGLVMTLMLQVVLDILDIQTKIRYSEATILLCIFVGVMASILAFIGPLIKIFKFKIIEAIKYE